MLAASQDTTRLINHMDSIRLSPVEVIAVLTPQPWQSDPSTIMGASCTAGNSRRRSTDCHLTMLWMRQMSVTADSTCAGPTSPVAAQLGSEGLCVELF